MPVSPGASGMQPRDPCRPWRGTLASGHKPRGGLLALPSLESNPQLSFATRMEDWTCLGQHKRQPEFPVVTRESRRNSRKTTWLPRHRKVGANWTALLAAALEHAGEWLGFGAKSAVGYGRLAPDRKALAAQEAAARKRGEEALEKAREEAERARLATLPAWEQTVASVLAAKPKDVKDYDALLKALEANRWPDAEERTRVAARVAQLLKEHGQWRERSEKKNPAKDEPYQRTLRLKKFL